MSVLDQITVVDLSHGRCGAYAAMQLSDFGARVIRLGNAADDADLAALYQGSEYLPADTDVNELISKADVLIAERNTLPEGMTAEALRAKYGRMVIACVREDAVVGGPLAEAESGMMNMCGFTDGAPTLTGSRVSENFAGVSMAFAITAALNNVAAHGMGALIDYSLYDTYYSLLESPILFRELEHYTPDRCGSADPATLVPYDVFRCKDGHFSAGLASDAGWDRFCGVLGMPELINDPRYDNNEKRCKCYAEMTAIFAPFFAAHTRAELQEMFSAANIPSAPVYSVHEAKEDPQLQARNMVRTADGMTLTGTPMKMSVSKPVYDAE